MYQRGEAGGSGEARPDQKMGRKRPEPARAWGIVPIDLGYTKPRPTTNQRQAMKRKANAKRRRRDKKDNDE